jgi:hypothetical protein
VTDVTRNHPIRYYPFAGQVIPVSSTEPKTRSSGRRGVSRTWSTFTGSIYSVLFPNPRRGWHRRDCGQCLSSRSSATFRRD